MPNASLIAELRRRNVIRAAVLYIGAVWALAQGIAQLGPTVGAPEAATRWFLAAAAIGFPFWIAFAWLYEFTPEGVKRERDVERSESITPHTGRKLDFAIIAVLAIAVVLLLTDRFVVTPRREAALIEQAAKGAVGASIPEIEADPSIAVLPMVNMSEDKANEFFSDGISEELLNLLAKVPKLRVIARTSSFSFKGKEVPIPEIAKMLHVASVLEGSVRKSGDKVRITAQLIRASDGSHLWSDTYDRTLDDIFKVQDEIAAAVVEQLKVKLLGAAPTAKPVDPRAYPLILQAQALSDQQSRNSRAEAESLYRQALAIAPNAGRAWSGLARVYFNQSLFGEGEGTERVQLAREAANKALAIDANDAIALGALGRIASDFEFDLPRSGRYLEQALRVGPENSSVLNAVAVTLGNIGRFNEAIQLHRYRVAHDPANATAYNNLGIALYAAREWDAAEAAFRAGMRLSPQASGTPASLGLVLLLGKHDAAAALDECAADSDEVSRMQCQALALHALGRTQEADAVQRTFVEKYGGEQPGYVATLFAYRGNADAAFEWLDKGAAIHDPQLSSVLIEPLLDSLHGDPRWLPLLRRIGLAPEQLAKVELKVTLPQ
jgi:TolB-like protein/Flp pilus assembly protein TadD